MKNRNKRFTSVVAASMALAAIAPVAPVISSFAASSTPVYEAGDQWGGPIGGFFTPANSAVTYGDIDVDNMTVSVVSINVDDLKTSSVTIAGSYTLTSADIKAIKAECTDPSKVTVEAGDTFTVTQIGNGSAVFTSAEGAENSFVKSVTVNANAAIAANAFNGQTKLTTVKLGTSGNIGDDAFANCTALTSVTLSSNCKTIGENAFANDTALTSISIPAGVNTIKDGAFAGTKLAGTIEMPSSVYTIGNNAFNSASTSNLAIVLPAVNSNIGFYCQNLGEDIFGKEGNAEYRQIYGSLPTLQVDDAGKNGDYYIATPSVTLGTVNKADEVTASSLTVEVGADVYVKTTQPGTVTVTKDGSAYKTYTAESKDEVIRILTPQIGTYTVTAANAAGYTSSSVTFTVTAIGETVEQKTNEWTNLNLTCADVSLGKDPQPSGLASLYGDVVYEYTQNPYNEDSWTTDIPDAEGTWYVRGIVEETEEYTGLDSNDEIDPFEFEVTEAEAPEYVNEWVENEDGTWSYYGEDGEAIESGIVTLPIANDSEETADFWFVDGVMQKGWYEDNDNKIHYFSSVSGAMLKNRWVSVDSEGNYVDWQKNPTAVAAYYYVDGEGDVVKDAFKYNECYTYGDDETDGHYYAFAKDGAMETGWVDHNGNRYYFAPRTGIMLQSRWAEIDGNWYYFGDNGAMAKDETIDGKYYVGADGVWDGITL